jgi:hypothetical protein
MRCKQAVDKCYELYILLNIPKGIGVKDKFKCYNVNFKRKRLKQVKIDLYA